MEVWTDRRWQKDGHQSKDVQNWFRKTQGKPIYSVQRDDLEFCTNIEQSSKFSYEETWL